MWWSGSRLSSVRLGIDDMCLPINVRDCTSNSSNIDKYKLYNNKGIARVGNVGDGHIGNICGYSNRGFATIIQEHPKQLQKVSMFSLSKKKRQNIIKVIKNASSLLLNKLNLHGVLLKIV